MLRNVSKHGESDGKEHGTLNGSLAYKGCSLLSFHCNNNQSTINSTQCASRTLSKKQQSRRGNGRNSTLISFRFFRINEIQ